MADEQPLCFMREVGESMADLVVTGIDAHREQDHVPPPRTDPPQAVPFPDERIPDTRLAQMVELMETENCDEQIAASMFGYPLSLALRELADYKRRFHRFILARAGRH